MKKIINGICICVILAFAPLYYHEYLILKEIAYPRDARVYEIYNKIWLATGQMQSKVPLKIVKSSEQNAYTNGSVVVIYTGMLDYAATDDEIALVLGHEIAHITLQHMFMMAVISTLLKNTDPEQQVLEANADKMGAFYAWKAGYDICTGRELFKRWLKDHGNTLQRNHPANSYRFDELDVRCN